MPRIAINERTYFVYLLCNWKGMLYAGVTNNLEFRLVQHKTGQGSAFTARYGIDRLLWFDVTSSIEAAIAREKQIKGWTRAKKVARIKVGNPHFRDLSKEWLEERDSSLPPSRFHRDFGGSE